MPFVSTASWRRWPPLHPSPPCRSPGGREKGGSKTVAPMACRETPSGRPLTGTCGPVRDRAAVAAPELPLFRAAEAKPARSRSAAATRHRTGRRSAPACGCGARRNTLAANRRAARSPKVRATSQRCGSGSRDHTPAACRASRTA